MNETLTISMITREALRVLENNLAFTKLVNRTYDAKYGVEGAKIGTVLNVRKPPRYVGRTGQALSVEGAVESQVQVSLTTQFGVDLQLSSQDLALSIDDFSDRFIKPAIACVANKIDNDGLALYQNIYQSIGTPGTTPSTLLSYLQTGQKLNEAAAPDDGLRSLVITTAMQVTIVNALTGLFHQANAISQQYMTGKMGTAIGYEWYMSQNCNTHTVGAYAGTARVNGASQTGASLITDGWTASTSVLEVGDIFTVASVNSVNPQSRQNTGQLQQFVVTAQVTASGAGAKTISISPSISASGQNQTVNALPADDALITVVGAASQASPQGLAFHRDAFTLVCADLPLPGGVDMAARISDPQLGLSIRMIRAYDINTDNFPCRLDILYGWATLRPELACRIQG